LKRLAVLATAIVVLVVLVVAQLVLPGIAAQRLRDRLSGSGTVTSVKVSAFPAIELLWHQADRVVIRMTDYRAGASALGSTLAGAGDVGSVDASTSQLDVGLLTLRDASLIKRGNELTGSARVTQADLRAAVPFIDDVRPLATGGGELTLQGTATLFGVSATVAATVAAEGGSVIVQPDVPLGGLATVTVFSNPHVSVASIAASSTPDGFALRARGQLH
jgi:LmeA-like phospholipid-binding